MKTTNLLPKNKGRFKGVLLFLLSFLSHFAYSQSESNDMITYDTVFVNSKITWTFRITRPRNMFTPNHPDTSSRPAIITMPGQGEVGTNPANLVKFGPHYWLNNGWDGGVQLGNGRHYPILITVLTSIENVRPQNVMTALQHLLNTYHIKRNSVHLGGLSMGAFTWGRFITYAEKAGDETAMSMVKSFTALQGMSVVDFNGVSWGMDGFGRWAKKYGGKFFGLEGTQDGRKVWQARDNMETSVPGSAYFSYEDYGGGGHCCWNSMYDPFQTDWQCTGTITNPNVRTTKNQPNSMGTYKKGSSIFQWMLRQGDTTLVQGSVIPVPPKEEEEEKITIDANAQSLNLILPVNFTILTGTVTGNKKPVTMLWEKKAGPASFSLALPNSAISQVTSLVVGDYTFTFKVTDANNKVYTKDVKVSVASLLPPVIPPTKPEEPKDLPKIMVGPGEYQVGFIDGDGHLWGVGNLSNIGVNKKGTPGLLQRILVEPFNLKFKFVAGGLHALGAIDENGYVWMMGDNYQGLHGMGDIIEPILLPRKIVVDDSGQPFRDVKQIMFTFYHPNQASGCYAVKEDGTVWGWGRLDAGFRGDGTDVSGAIYSRPVQIIIPGNRKVKEISVGSVCIALCTDGTVWTWGKGSAANLGYVPETANDYRSPHQLTTLSNIVHVAGGGNFNYALQSNGKLFGWGSWGNFMGDPVYPTGGGTTYPTPRELTNITNGLPAKIEKMVTTWATTHAILSDGSLWGWGDNAQGGVGNGQSLDWATYPTPYSWSGVVGQLYVKKPVNIAPTIKFKDVWGGNTYNYFSYALDENNQLYCWGRGKGDVLVTGIVSPNSDITALKKNSWDRNWPTPIDPFSMKSIYQATSPDCITNGTGVCLNYSIPKNKEPKADAGKDQSITVYEARLDGTGSKDNVFISYYEWKQVSGPNTAIIDLPASKTPRVSGLVTGTYVFQLKTTDNGWMSDSALVTIFVNGGGNQAPVANAGSNTTITLPDNSVELNGGGSSDPEGKPLSYSWIKLTGPSTGIIENNTNAKATAKNLAEGVYEFELTVKDSEGVTAKAKITITVKAAPVANKPPVAKAGSAVVITLPVNTVTLDGTGSSDEDGSIVSYSWKKSSGPASGGTISSGLSATISVTDLIEGEYVYELTVKDDKGATAGAQVKVTVNPAPIVNQPPTANAGNNQTITLPVSTVTLNGSGSADPDGTISSYSWVKKSGPAYGGIANSNAASTTISGLLEGVYLFELTVRDNKGATNSAQITITVNPAPNQAPVANAGNNQTITLPANTATLNGSGSDDPDGSISSYSWVKKSGPAYGGIANSNAASTMVTGLQEGVYVFELTVTDDNGAVDHDQVMVTVVSIAIVNKPPVASAGNNLVVTLPLNSAALNGSGSGDPDGTIASYSWVKTGGPGYDGIANSGAVSTTVSGLQEGVYSFELTVTDNEGLTDKDQVTITVNPAANKAPVANAGSNQTITLPTNTATLNGSGSSDPDGTISTYSWAKRSGPAYGGITNSNVANTTVSGLQEGVYLFELTVTDNKGATHSTQITITVKAAVVPNKAPVANAGSNQTITLPTNTATLNGSGSSDPDGTISTYSWAKRSGPAYGGITNSNVANTTVSGLQEGVYLFELTVTDNKGATHSAQVTITVNTAPNKAPVANAGNDITVTLPANSAILDGSASSDPDGTIVKYNWSKISGPNPFTILNSNTDKPSLPGLLEGTYEFELTVTDNKGAWAKDRVVVTVKAGQVTDKAPVAVTGSDQVIMLPETTATLDGSASKVIDGGTIKSYQWTQVSGPSTALILYNNAAVTSIARLVEGEYSFELTVTDDKGVQAKSVVKVTVVYNIGRTMENLTIYPVPTDDVLNFSYQTDKLDEELMITIFDSNGRSMLSERFSKKHPLITDKINVITLKSGIYFFQIKGEDGKAVLKKFMKK